MVSEDVFDVNKLCTAAALDFAGPRGMLMASASSSVGSTNHVMTFQKLWKLDVVPLVGSRSRHSTSVIVQDVDCQDRFGSELRTPPFKAHAVDEAYEVHSVGVSSTADNFTSTT